MCLARGQGKLPALLIARLKSLHLIGPVIHEGIIQRGSLSKTQIDSFWLSKKQQGPRNKWALRKTAKQPLVLCLELYAAPQNYHRHREVNLKLWLLPKFEATSSFKTWKTSLCLAIPLLWSDGLALNTIHCLVCRLMKDNCWVLGVNPLMAQSILWVKKAALQETRNVQIPQGVNLINYLWLQKYSCL